jgi:hypothetical protein
MNYKKPRRKCLFCQKEVKEIISIYCSIKCQHAYIWMLKKEEIERNGEFKSDSRTCKRYLIEKFGCKCVICNRDEWDGKPMPVVLDHIDGNSDNWKSENLRLICPNCDTFTPFYKGRNKGNGRFKRRQRYLTGLSY